MYFRLSYWTTAGRVQSCQSATVATISTIPQPSVSRRILSRRGSKSSPPYCGSRAQPKSAGEYGLR